MAQSLEVGALYRAELVQFLCDLGMVYQERMKKKEYRIQKSEDRMKEKGLR